MLNPDQNIELNLTASECNVVMMGLVEVPYKIAAPLIDKVRSQILAIDPTAFDPPAGNSPMANGMMAEPTVQ